VSPKGAVGLVGLGNMGSAFADRMLAAGYAVVGFDPDPDARHAFEAAGGTAVGDCATVAQGAGQVILSLPSAAALEAAVTGARGLRAGASAEQVILETSTLPVAAKLSARDALAEHGACLLDCAVSGTPTSVRAGQLALYASGDEEAFERAAELVGTLGARTRFVGAFGAATKLKLICNLLVVIHDAATAEAMALGIGAGFDPHLVYEVVCDGIGSSRVFEQRGAMMAEGDYRPGSRTFLLGLKDGALIDELARETGTFAPVFGLARQLHTAAIGLGLGELDGAALLELYRSLSHHQQEVDVAVP
jgi:3-hydroxyisobutyrate dehydrogenase-like beta-hydroxyacid dehydrogenase